jgi:hypothetical protein
MTSPRTAFCIPIYDDWEAASELLQRIDDVAGQKGMDVDVFLIDDGSSIEPGDEIAGPFETIRRVEVLHMRRNLGHQRAIAVGLAYLHDHEEHARIVVMDGDGQDAPEDVPRLLEVLDSSPTHVVFAARARRSESLTFRFFYQAFKALHVLLTGMKVEVGNFSAVPRAALDRLVAVSEMWNHYAAAVHKARVPSTNVPIARSVRLAGESRMNFVNLAAHGLSAMSVHGEVIGVRLLVASGALISLSITALITMGILAALPAVQLPAWSTLVAGLLVLLTGITVLLALIFVFVILQGRAGATFLPIRDYSYYVARMTTAYAGGAGE